MKIVLKIIIINILLIAFLFAGFETYFYKKDLNFVKYKLGDNSVKYLLKKNSFERKFNEFLEKKRKIVGTEYKKQPIILLGCSYTYGFNLKENEALHYKISKKAKRPVYNWAYLSWGIQHAYYVINKMPTIEPEPEYIFYIFINDHIRRMLITSYKTDYVENLQYKLKNGKLEKKDNRYNIFDNSYFLYNIKNFFIHKIKYYKYYIYSNKTQNLFIDYACCLKKEINKKYPNSKFVIIIYDYMPEELIKDLKNNNIGIFYLKNVKDFDLDNEKYKLSKEVDYFQHPNEKAWEVVSDAIIKEFHL